jgi:cupin fold WbuC family metalloprotein
MVYALNIPAGQWHTLRALESGTVILEMKDGAYEPIGAEDVMER